MSSSLSARGRRSAQMSTGWESYNRKIRSDPYHGSKNPEGIINMARAENRLCEDILMERLNRPDINRHECWMQYYSDARGISRLRKSLAEFMTTHFKSIYPIDEEDLYITYGASGAIDMLTHAYVDPGDSFLCLAPHYAYIPMHIGCRADIYCHSIQLCPEKSFEITWDLLEHGFHEAAEKCSGAVKAMFITSPNNPIGEVYDVSTIRLVLDFCHSHDIHAIFDEIFAFSVFDPDTTFHSVLSLADILDPVKTHVIWGFSKDLALPGFHVGVLCSRDRELASSLSLLHSLASTPPAMQHKAATLIEDTDWLDQIYFPTNLSRMRSAHEYSCLRLTQLGIPFYPSRATYFIWADFSKYVVPPTRERERQLIHEIFLHKVFIQPGSTHGVHTPGWMRIVFTLPRDVLTAGFNRLGEALKRIEKVRVRQEEQPY